MNSEIILKSRAIMKDMLDPNQYTVSLLKEGMQLGLIDKQMMYGIQEQIMQLLQELIMRYTKGDSTSVKVETAEKILSSLYYSIDASMYSYDEPEKAMEELVAKRIREIYEKGIGLVTACVAEAEELYRKIVAMKLDVQLIAYNTTIDEASPNFFRDYGVVFEAHETMFDADYPLAVDIGNLRGIFYIKKYLQTLDMETRFCRNFSDADINRVLIWYGKICGVDHREPLVNIFELVINNSIFSVVSGSHAGSLVISKSQYELLHKRIRGLNASELSSLLDAATEKILDELEIGDTKLIDYIDKYKAVFVQRLINAAINDSLGNLVFVDAEKVQKPERASLIEGDKMSDESFRAVVRMIVESRGIGEKISIIKSRISSLGDFVDILEADCLFGDEYIALFEALSDMELAVLGRAAAEETGAGEEWQAEYGRFIQCLGKDRAIAIEALADAIGVS